VLENLLKTRTDIFKASMPSSYRYVITQGLDFTLKEAMNSHMNFADHIPLTMLGTHFLTGATAGLVSFTVLYPEDIITNQYTIDKKTRQISAIPARDAIRSIWKTKGLRGFYYKYSWNAPAVAVNKGIYFGVYDTLKHHVIDEDYRSWFSLCFVVGCASAFLAAVIPHPMFLASGNKDRKATYRAALKEELRSVVTWKFPNLGIRTVRGGLLLATFDKITSLVYNRSNKPKIRRPGDFDEKYVL